MCIKSLQNTSSMVQNGFSSNRVKNLLHLFVPHMLAFSRPDSSDIVRPPNRCSVSVTTCLWTYYSATSRAVYDATWNKQGENSHPICRADGITNSVGASGWFGRTKEKFHSSPAAHTIIQDPCLISNLLKWIGSSDSGAVTNASMMWGITIPTCSSASAGASSFVALFTDGRSHPAIFNTNDRSKTSLY